MRKMHTFRHYMVNGNRRINAANNAGRIVGYAVLVLPVENNAIVHGILSGKHGSFIVQVYLAAIYKWKNTPSHQTVEYI